MIFVLLYGLWILFNAQVTFEILWIGLIVVGLVWGLSMKMLGTSPREDFRRLAKVPKAIAYLCWLLKEVIVSALHVMRVIWAPGQPVSTVTRFHSGLRTGMGRVILADSITLTPGTITANAQEDGVFQVHCLEATAAEDLDHNEMLHRVQKLEGSKA